MTRLLILVCLLVAASCQTVTMQIPQGDGTFNYIPIVQQGVLDDQFQYKSTCSCKMDPMYVFEQWNSSVSKYFISVEGVGSNTPVSISSKYSQFSGTLDSNLCTQSCLIQVNNNCPEGKYNINMFTISIGGLQNSSYMVNCNPAVKYKPFEIGLLLILALSIGTAAICSLFSRANSLGEFYIRVSYKIVLGLNILLVTIGALVFIDPPYYSDVINITASIIGTAGVFITTNQILWMFQTKLNQKRLGKVRTLDIVSMAIAFVVLLAYWLTGTSWIISDIMAFCTITASIKIFRIDSLRMGCIFLFSVVFLQTVSGLVIHYLFRVSYNNLVINSYTNPLLLQFPSITPELYRKCAWLPCLSIIQPGLVISYLRRFDISRSTIMYLFIGFASLFVGSGVWMFLDLATVHTVPLGLINEPLMILIVIGFAYKRNENRTLWNGHFHDPDVYSLKQALVTGGTRSMQFSNFTNDFRVSRQSSELQI